MYISTSDDVKTKINKITLQTILLEVEIRVGVGVVSGTRKELKKLKRRVGG